MSLKKLIDEIEKLEKTRNELKEKLSKCTKIDGIRFKLIEKGKKGKYNVVKLISFDGSETTELVFYHSNSQGGFWRLCFSSLMFNMLIKKYSNHYEKGENYTLSSFIDIRLQIFINNNIDTLKEGECDVDYCPYKKCDEELDTDDVYNSYIKGKKGIKDDVLKSSDFIEHYRNKMRQNCNKKFNYTEKALKHLADKKIGDNSKKSTKHYYDHLYDKNRDSNDNALKAIEDLCPTGLCFVNECIGNKILNRYSNKEKITNYHRSLARDFKLNEVSRFKRNLDKELNSFKKDSKKYKEKQKENYKKIREYLCNLYENPKEIFTAIDKYMTEHFNLVTDSNKYLGTFTVTVANDIILTHELYEVKIKNKETKKIYKVIYSKYNTNLPYFKETYNLIIIVVPDNAKITKYGTYSQYTSAGQYTSKILEYHSQFKVLSEEEKERRKNDNYYFIGDYSTDLFPMNSI